MHRELCNYVFSSSVLLCFTTEHIFYFLLLHRADQSQLARNSCPRLHFWLSVWFLSCRCRVRFPMQYQPCSYFSYTTDSLNPLSSVPSSLSRAAWTSRAASTREACQYLSLTCSAQCYYLGLSYDFLLLWWRCCDENKPPCSAQTPSVIQRPCSRQSPSAIPFQAVPLLRIPPFRVRLQRSLNQMSPGCSIRKRLPQEYYWSLPLSPWI